AVPLESAPDTRRDEVVIHARSPFSGAKVANLSPALAEELHLEAPSEGVVIVEIEEGSPASSFGFQRGDLILVVNNERIAKPQDLERVARSGSRLWRITLSRGGQQISVVLSG